MSLLSNFCGCISLKTGALLIGSLNLVTSILGVLISTWCLTDSRALAELLLEQSNPDWREKIHKTYYDSKKELEQQTIYSLSSEISTYGVIFLIGSIFTVAFSACLVHGIRTRNVRLMMPWIVMMGISLFLNIFNILFGIASNPSPANIAIRTIGWALWLYFFLVVCAFKAELEKEGEPARAALPAAPASVSPTGFLDLPSLKREGKIKNGSDNIKYQPLDGMGWI